MKRELRYAAIFLILAVMLAYYATTGSWYRLLAWPAIAFAAVSIAYLFQTPWLFGKRRDGSRTIWATILLMPYLLFAYVTWSIQVRLSRENAVDRVNDSLALSRRLFATELPSDVHRVCDLCSELADPYAIRSIAHYVCYPILDASTSNPEALIDLARSLASDPASPLLVHCANGHGRTGMFAAIWLLCHGFAKEPAQAIAMIMAARPSVRLGPNQFATVEKAYSLMASKGGLVADERQVAIIE